MHVDVEQAWIDVDEERYGRKLAGKKRLAKCCHRGLLKESVSDGSSVDDLEKFPGRGETESLEPIKLGFESAAFTFGLNQRKRIILGKDRFHAV